MSSLFAPIRMGEGRRRGGHRPHRSLTFALGVQIAAGLVAIVASLPLGFVVWVSVRSGWAEALALIWRPRIGELLVNTTLLVSLAVPLATATGLGIAWLTERSNVPCPGLWRWLGTAPLAIPAFVHSYGWTSAAPGFGGLPAGVLIAVLAYFPFVFLPVSASLRRLDPALEDAAASLGLAPHVAFRRVLLPQLKVALSGGALIVGLHLLAEYGLFALVRFDTFTTAIVDQFQSSYAGPSANMMAGVLVVACLGCLWLDATARGATRLARLGSGVARMPTRRRLGWATIPAILALVLLALLSVGVPLATLGRWLAAGGSAVWRFDLILPALIQTLGLAAAGAATAILAAIPMAWLSVRAPSPVNRAIEGAYYVVGSLPGVVVALALVTITVRVALPLYQTTMCLVFAYGLIFLPRALISLRASFALAPAELEQVAQSLGRSPARAVGSVTLRIATPGIAAGAALVALGITNELVATQMLAPTGTQTLAMAFWAASSELDYGAAAPYGALMILLSLPLIRLLPSS